MKPWDTDGSHLLHLCFDNITEYDPDVVFDKKCDFLSFLLKMLLFLFYETYLHSSVDKKKKTMFKARIKGIFCLKVEGLVFILMYCMFRYSYNTKYSAGHDILVKISKNAGGRWQLSSKTLAGKLLNVYYIQ